MRVYELGPTMKDKKQHVGWANKDIPLPADVSTLLCGILIYAIVIFRFNALMVTDPDPYWHITLGNWMLTEHAIPRHDFYSYTALGNSWVDAEWLAQIILAAAYDLFGWRGLILLSGLTIAFTFALMFKLLSRELRATVALGTTFVCYIFASDHFLTRPHLLTYPITVLWTAYLARACDGNRRPSFWLLPLMVLWANFHAGATLGLLLAAGFGLAATISAEPTQRRRVALEWIAFWLAALLAGCITPYGLKSLAQTYDVLGLGVILDHLSEWTPMNAYTNYKQVAILLILLALALIFGVKISLVRVLMVIWMLSVALRYVRGMDIFALVTPFIVAHPLQRQFAFLRASPDVFLLFDARQFRSVRPYTALAATLVLVAALGTAYRLFGFPDAPNTRMTPATAIDYALAAKVSGSVFNDYDFGGYLVFRGIPAFIDGRVLPYDRQFVLDYFKATAPDGGTLLDELTEKYKVTWTLLRPYSPAAFHFELSSAWRRLYADDIAVIYVRREANTGRRSEAGTENHKE
jgi:hypothetical protein